MKRSFVMGTEASFDLNFLIYIQNIFLAQHKGKLRFPYISRKVMLKDEFEIRYKELWNEVSQRIYDDYQNEVVPLDEKKNVFYQRLFVDDETSLKDFNEIYKTFEVWWNSFAGHVAIERSIDEMGQQLYAELANTLVQKGIKPQQQLNISLIYDECLIGEPKMSSYFAVVPIRDFFIRHNELVLKLEKCIV